jgi:hypothetical protein
VFVIVEITTCPLCSIKRKCGPIDGYNYLIDRGESHISNSVTKRDKQSKISNEERKSHMLFRNSLAVLLTH